MKSQEKILMESAIIVLKDLGVDTKALMKQRKIDIARAKRNLMLAHKYVGCPYCGCGYRIGEDGIQVSLAKHIQMVHA